MSDKKMAAKVKWFSKAKGFGFATVEGVEGDVMLHQSTIDMEGYRYLSANQEITIEGIKDTDSGKRALKISV